MPDHRLCLCGCGETPKGRKSEVVPGHDARVFGRLSRAVGGLENLQRLAEEHLKRPITADD